MWPALQLQPVFQANLNHVSVAIVSQFYCEVTEIYSVYSVFFYCVYVFTKYPKVLHKLKFKIKLQSDILGIMLVHCLVEN